MGFYEIISNIPHIPKLGHQAEADEADAEITDAEAQRLSWGMAVW